MKIIPYEKVRWADTEDVDKKLDKEYLKAGVSVSNVVFEFRDGLFIVIPYEDDNKIVRMGKYEKRKIVDIKGEFNRISGDYITDQEGNVYKVAE